MNLSQDELSAPNAGVDLVRGTANGVRDGGMLLLSAPISIHMYCTTEFYM